LKECTHTYAFICILDEWARMAKVERQARGQTNKQTKMAAAGFNENYLPEPSRVLDDE
jgi:hypothetical protein